MSFLVLPYLVRALVALSTAPELAIAVLQSYTGVIIDPAFMSVALPALAFVPLP